MNVLLSLSLYIDIVDGGNQWKQMMIMKISFKEQGQGVSSMDTNIDDSTYEDSSNVINLC